jgi:hypothetical protein
MQELRDLAAETAGRPVPMGANAGLLWPRHLADYKSLDLFSAETDHHASRAQMSDLPLFAYRMADAVKRPYAATASGGDWAYIAEHQRPGLVRGWIAFSYAAGHCLMAPHRQWCYTPEKGTHWYQGPADKFAPLYQFVRQNQELFDGFSAYADLGIVLPHRAFLRHPQRWFELAEQLAAKNVSYRILLGGDEIVDHALSADDLSGCKVLLAPEREQLSAQDRRVLEELNSGARIVGTIADALAMVTPAVQIEPVVQVRALPRISDHAVVIHLVNYNYSREKDDFGSTEPFRLKLDRSRLPIAAGAVCALVQPGVPEQRLEWNEGMIEIPSLQLWGMVRIGNAE